ncbi:MAG: glycoside hydrolase family 2 protein [Lachnospiraceae bacterium]|nr:glycoside hydrolase family 2 protein [Lachnospiraceae bacterium]
MSEKIMLNNGWQFTGEYSDELLSADCSLKLCDVRLPHNAAETPYHYFDDSIYQMICGYRRILHIPAEWEGKRVFITFMAVAHSATVYLNGTELASHGSGYTAFEVELTDVLKPGEDNILVVKANSREDQNIPPFGHVIDYMTYGGIYREVYIKVCDDLRMSEVYVDPAAPEEEDINGEIKDFRFNSTVGLDISLDERNGSVLSESGLNSLKLRVLVGEHKSGRVVTDTSFDFSELSSIELSGARLWDPVSPFLYDIYIELIKADEVIDSFECSFGFRRSVFKEDGYYLNGRKFRLRGLNRHQSYAYNGYAMPSSMQKLDAEILKLELGCNAVRTSHYPQSQHFIDRCDELGLLVFTEIPGWQHIGDEAWKEQACINVEEMIKQYKNHCSVILWGVRINESVDDDGFYTKTNEIAHSLDDTRPTGGVRYIEKSSLLEDVYTFNDFSHEGNNPGCKPKNAVTSDPSKPYLISEYCGHMFPTKSFDCEEHRLEHALRHANVLEAVNTNKDIAGSFGWCMFDYNTHKDFGSGDRICYHGVMDMFRNPKLAAYVYASQQNRTPVLEVSSSMDIGEHPGGNRGNIYIFTNADSVRMYKNDVLLKEYTSADSSYSHLRHAPILVDDYVGSALKEAEEFTDRQAAIVKKALNHIARYGMNNLPLDIKLKLGEAMTVYHMSFEQAYALYGKYVGNWGDAATTFRFEAIKDGEIVKTVTKTTSSTLTLDVRCDHTELREADTYDVAAVRVRVCDEYGNVQPFFNAPLKAELSGPVELAGPPYIQIAGGMGGCYVRTTGKTGAASVKISLPAEYSYLSECSRTLLFEISGS